MVKVLEDIMVVCTRNDINIYIEDSYTSCITLVSTIPISYAYEVRDILTYSSFLICISDTRIHLIDIENADKHSIHVIDINSKSHMIINNYLLEIINAKNIIDFTYINSELIEFKIDNNELSVIKKPKDIYNDINFEKIDELKETDLIYKKTIKIFDKYNYSTKKEDVENIYTKYYEILLGNKQKILELQELNNLISSIKTQFYGIDVCYDDYLYKLKKSNFLNIIFNTYCVENKDPTSLDVKEFQENLDKKVNKDMIITYIYSNYYYDIYLNIILSLIQNTILTNIINIIKNLIIFHRSQMKICLPINVIKQLKTTDEIKDKADNINDSILIIVKLLHDIKKTDIPDYIKNKITDNKDVIKYIQIIFNEYINKNLNLNNSNIKIYDF